MNTPFFSSLVLRLAIVIAALNALPAMAQEIYLSPMQRGFTTSYFMEINGDYAGAAAYLMKIYESGSYEMNLRLGWLYYMAGEHETAADFYRKAVDLAPGSVEARLGYVQPLSALEQWPIVETQYLDILKMDPYNSTVNYRLGLMYYYQADHAKANIYFSEALSAYPFSYDIVRDAAWNSLMLGDEETAKMLFNRVLMIRPNDEYALRGLQQLKP